MSTVFYIESKHWYFDGNIVDFKQLFSSAVKSSNFTSLTDLGFIALSSFPALLSFETLSRKYIIAKQKRNVVLLTVVERNTSRSLTFIITVQPSYKPENSSWKKSINQALQDK